MIDITEAYVKSHLPEIKTNAHKTARGRLLVIAGSYGMAGACIYVAKAALAMGAGYVTVCIPKSIYPIVAAAVPGAVFLPYNEEESTDFQETLKTGLLRADAAVFGCGIGNLRKMTGKAVFDNIKAPLLIDADGLNYLAQSGQKPCSEDFVLTPHEGEMGRLLNIAPDYISKNREWALKESVDKFGGTVLLKGPGTLIGTYGEGTLSIVRNTTGTKALSRAGSGDVLSGMIGSLMAQGLSCFDAASCGAYIHGLSGQIAARKKGVRSCLPEDYIDAIPEVFRNLSPGDFS